MTMTQNHVAALGDRKTRLICQPPKTAHSRRTIPLSADAIDALRRHKAVQAQEKLLFGEAYQDHGLVFCAPDGQPINPRLVTRQFQRLLQAAGMPHVRFHDLRHSVATMLLELGESPKTVQTLLGHSRINITLDIYSHVSLDLETRAVAKLTAALQGKR
jgi:integrase